MTSFLFERKIRIFDYPKFAEPFRNRIRENAEKVATGAGIEIEFIRKRNFLQKTIYSLPALRELREAANRRYREFLSAIEDPRAGRNRLDKLSQPVEQEGRRYSGFNLFDPGDENLLCSIVRGEFNISGLHNKNLRRHLPELSSGQVSRLLKRLRTHGLVKKVGHTYKYYVTTFGKEVVATALKLRELVIIPGLALAASH